MASRASAPTRTMAWAEARRTNTEPMPSGRTRSGSPVFARSSRAARSSLWSAKTVPLAKKAAVREWHRPARQRFTHRRHEGPAVPRHGSTLGRREQEADGGANAAFAEAAEGGANPASGGVPPAVVDAHRWAAKLTAVQELRGARHAMDTADLGMVSDAAAALPVIEALCPLPAPADPDEYSPAEEPPDLRRAPPSRVGNADEVRREHIRDLDVPSWRLWVNRCRAGRCHSRTAAFLASGTVFALHKDDLAAREERAKTGEPLRVRPLGVGSVLMRLASAHAIVRVGADAREAMGPTGFLIRMMPPSSELNPFVEAVDVVIYSASM
eukprot:jgi/Tetstr1/458097/TSEL_044604.t1